MSEIKDFFGPTMHGNFESDPAANRLAKDIHGLLSAMASDRSVFFVLEKYPQRDLSRGRHWYSMYYVNGAGKKVKFWPAGDVGASLVRMDINNRDRSLPLWMFSSGAIGMDRLLDATGTLCRVLAECGGFQDCQFTHSDCL